MVNQLRGTHRNTASLRELRGAKKKAAKTSYWRLGAPQKSLKRCSANRTILLALQCFGDSLFAVAALEIKKSNAVVVGMERATVWLRKLRGFRSKNLCKLLKKNTKAEEKSFTLVRKSAARNAPRSTASLKS